MKYITYEMIKNKDINDIEWLHWAEHVLKNKYNYIMPAKTSLHFGSSYMNTMPSILPNENVMGVKQVNRYISRVPALDSQILLLDYSTGENLALMDGNLITAMRTGAATVVNMKLFANPDFEEIGMMGFGNVGLATLKVLLEAYKDKEFTLKLLRYKDHADKVIERFSKFKNVNFRIVDDIEDLIRNSDVVISAITYTDKDLAKPEWFKKGCLLIPEHLRGFQNCDLAFDKIYGDDRGQVSGFKYFNDFKFFSETSQVLTGEMPGRESEDERIIVYNVGLSIHDIYAAKMIYENYFTNEPDLPILHPVEKNWM